MNTEPLFKELNILDFDKSKLLAFCKFMWHIKNNIIPDTISKLFKENDGDGYIIYLWGR